MHHTCNTYTISQPSNASWTPELMLSMKGTFERQYARDKLIDILYNEQRRVRKAVQGPVEGYHHPNEINGVRLPRKGRGIQPTIHSEEPVDNKHMVPRKGKGLPRVGLPPAFSYDKRMLASAAQVPEDQQEQLWPCKGKRIVPGPADAREQLWPCKGKRIVQGRSHMQHNAQAVMAWNPGAEDSLPPPPPPHAIRQEKIGKRCNPQATRSSVVLG